MNRKPTYEELEERIIQLEKQVDKLIHINAKNRDVTEQKKAETALRESQERFRLAFMTSPDSININRLEDGLYIDINNGFTEIMGYERDEVIGKKSGELNIWKNSEDREKLVRDLNLKGFVNNLEAEFLGKNGKTKYGLMSARTLTMNNESVILSITRDITERKISEKVLRKSEDYMRSIFRAAPVGIGVVHDRVISQVNAKFCEMLGYSPDELLGQKARIVYPDDEAYEWVGREKYKQISQSGTGTVETRLHCKDGSDIDVLLSSTPIEIKNLDEGVTFTALDITSFKRTQAALERSKKKYQTMMETIKAPVYICSKEYQIQYLNPAMVNRIGYDATGALCYEALHGFEKPCSWCNMEKTFESGHSEKDIVSPKDNRSFHVSSTIFLNEDGLKFKLSIFRDITEFISLQNRLQQAQKMETIGTLAGGIAHDFNNILFPILGYAEILKNDIPSDDVATHESLNQIHSSAIRAKDLVSQILTFARQKETEYKPLRIQLILKEAIKLLRSTIPKEIEIKNYVSPGCRPIVADATQVHQVIMNLMTNAYQAMADRGGVLTIQLEEIDVSIDDNSIDGIDKGRYARLLVADTGSGMTEEVKSKIFDPFFTTKKKEMGTGLGLSVVHGIMKKMNGHIRVKSGIGQGTEFQVYFPIDPAPETDNTRQQFAGQTIPKGHETILLVDDELPIINMEKQSLERLGYKVESETDPLRALEIFTKEPDKFDLVITDLSMPKLSGDKLSFELAQIRPDVPIVICTGFSEKFTPENAKKAGIKTVLLKPVGMEEMALKIREALG